MADPVDPTLAALVEAAVPHVAFDGWSQTSFRAAIRDSGIDPVLAEAVAPAGALDLAVAFHRIGDVEMSARVAAADLSEMRYRDKVTFAVRQRLEAIPDREAVRRGMTLFALPQNVGLGTRALWGTADAIWTALGDTSDDINWYTKRATLSAVYGATVLFWLGDDSPAYRDTWAFLDRRIEDVMSIEKAKAKVRSAPGLGDLMALPDRILSGLRKAADARPGPAGRS